EVTILGRTSGVRSREDGQGTPGAEQAFAAGQGDLGQRCRREGGVQGAAVDEAGRPQVQRSFPGGGGWLMGIRNGWRRRKIPSPPRATKWRADKAPPPKHIINGGRNSI